MTEQEIDSLTEREAKDKLRAFFSNAESAQSYLAIQGQIANIAEQIDRIEIDISSDASDKAFDRFMNFGQKLNIIEKSQRERRALLDEEVLRKEREKRNAAKSGRLEQFVNEGFMGEREDGRKGNKKANSKG